MSDDEPKSEVTLRLRWTDHAPKKLADRIREFKNQSRVELEDQVAAIQFLRGAASRASFVSPSLYTALGARAFPHKPDRPHWQIVQAAALEQSSLQVIALACRSIFDDSKSRLSGKRIARLNDVTRASVAKFWADNSGKSTEEALAALRLLSKLLDRCARPEKELLEKPSLLERRIGLLKYYAHRQAAHISLEPYLFDILDLIHVAAAIVLIGAIVVDFDMPNGAKNYFDSIDEGGWKAAKAIFPTMPMDDRIFKRWDIHQQAESKWKNPYLDGVEYILNQLPSAIGFWDSRPESD